jgi:hypothetical protein
LKTLITYVLASLISTPKRVNEYLKIRVLRTHLRYELIQSGVISARTVILAVYPGTTSLFSLNRMMQSISSSNFALVVVVNNHSGSSEVVEMLRKYNCTVLLRKNIGRDIGAYQCGIHFLGIDQLAEKFDKIALLNDSLYVTDHSVEFYENFLTNDKWNCLYLNLQDTPHASSHSLILDKEALATSSLVNFWRKYYPSSSRIHSVFRGEFAITKSLGLQYFKPYVSVELISNGSFELNKAEINQIKVWSKRSKSVAADLIDTFLENGDHTDAVICCLENYQVSNSLGFFLYNKFGIPIKLDICKYQLVSKVSFIGSLGANMSTEERVALEKRLGPSATKFTGTISYNLHKVIRQIKENL